MFCLFSLSIQSAYTILGSVQRGTKRARIDLSPAELRPRTRTSASVRQNTARAQNEDCTYQSTSVATDTTAKQLFRILFCSLSTAELEVVVKDGNRELDRRHGIL